MAFNVSFLDDGYCILAAAVAPSELLLPTLCICDKSTWRTDEVDGRGRSKYESYTGVADVDGVSEGDGNTDGVDGEEFAEDVSEGVEVGDGKVWSESWSCGLLSDSGVWGSTGYIGRNWKFCSLEFGGDDGGRDEGGGELIDSCSSSIGIKGRNLLGGLGDLDEECGVPEVGVDAVPVFADAGEPEVDLSSANNGSSATGTPFNSVGSFGSYPGLLGDARGTESLSS